MWEEDCSALKAYLDAQNVDSIADWFAANPTNMDEAVAKIQVLHVNPACLKLYGANSFEELMEALPRLFTPNALKAFGQGISQMYDHREDGFEIETNSYRVAGESFTANVRAALLPGSLDTWERLVVTVVDISETRGLQRQLDQAQKMEALGRLAGGVAHDFNNLLTALSGYAEFIKDATDPQGPIHEDVTQMMDCIDRATLLTKQLLNFSRKNEQNVEEFDGGHRLRELFPFLRRVIPPRIELVVDTPDEDIWIQVNRSQFDNAIMNLVTNAIDAIPEHGTIHMTGRRVHDLVQIRVRDSGRGMKPEVVARALEPFFTTKETGKGTGLGLANVYGMVQRSRGRLEVQSEPGVGTEILLEFPLIAPQHHPSSMAGSERLPIESIRGTERLLVVEDEDVVRLLCMRYLSELGYDVVSAASGSAALQAIENGHHFDLVLSDVVMPMLDGPTMVEQIRTTEPDIPVLFMSGFTNKNLEARGMEDPLLPKPFTLEELALTLRNVLDQSRQDGTNQNTVA